MAGLGSVFVEDFNDLVDIFSLHHPVFDGKTDLPGRRSQGIRAIEKTDFPMIFLNR